MDRGGCSGAAATRGAVAQTGIKLYRTEPAGGIIQDRGYQESVLGQPFC